MKRNQKVCLWVGMAVFVEMGLYPPWYHTQDTWSRYRYSFLWDPPIRDYYDRETIQWMDRNYNPRAGGWQEHYFDRDLEEWVTRFRSGLPPQLDLYYHLDFHRLCVQWAMVAVVTGGLMLTFHRRKEMSPPRPESGLLH